MFLSSQSYLKYNNNVYVVAGTIVLYNSKSFQSQTVKNIYLLLRNFTSCLVSVSKESFSDKHMAFTNTVYKSGAKQYHTENCHQKFYFTAQTMA